MAFDTRPMTWIGGSRTLGHLHRDPKGTMDTIGYPLPPDSNGKGLKFFETTQTVEDKDAICRRLWKPCKLRSAGFYSCVYRESSHYEFEVSSRSTTRPSTCLLGVFNPSLNVVPYELIWTNCRWLIEQVWNHQPFRIINAYKIKFFPVLLV